MVLTGKCLWQDSIFGAKIPATCYPSLLQEACITAGLAGTGKLQDCSSPSQGTTELMAACAELWESGECTVGWLEGHMQWLDLESGTAPGSSGDRGKGSPTSAGRSQRDLGMRNC